MELTEILGMALKARASDIHIKPGLPPVYRIDGSLRPHPKLPRLTPDPPLPARHRAVPRLSIPRMHWRGPPSYVAPPGRWAP